MRIHWIAFSTLVLTLGLSGFSMAGSKVDSPVTIVPGMFSGGLGAARNSADFAQLIGCSDLGGMVVCTAVDVAFSSAACATRDPVLIDVVRGISTATLIAVAHDGAGTCTAISATKSSLFENQ